MGLFKDAMRGKEINGEQDGSEENKIASDQEYMKLFMKIGRDFVHKDDIIIIIDKLLEALDPLGQSGIRSSDLVADIGAKRRAEEYKHFLDNDKLGSDYYNDLIDLSEE
jgi:hypothetical protein